MHKLLKNGSFMRLFCGRLVTNAGDSLYQVAAMWLVYDLTGSAMYTGIAGFLTMAPEAFQFIFGPFVDRTPLRRVLVGTQLVQGVLLLAIPIAAAIDALSVWLVLFTMPLLTLLNQPVYPAESAALPRIVERDDLVGGNSLLSVAYQGTNAAFKAFGGVLVAVLGAITLFLVDTVTFGIAALLFATLSIPDGEDTKNTGKKTSTKRAATDGGESTEADKSQQSYTDDLREGINYLRGTFIAKLLVGAVVVNFAIGGVIAVLPAYAAILGGPSAYGVLTASIGVGTLTGALVGNAVKRFPFGYVVIVGMAVSAVLWLGAVAIEWLPASALLFALALVPAGVMNVLTISLIQALVPDDLLGRITAVLGSASAAMTPIGSLVGGFVAGITSATVVLSVAGGAFALLSFYVFSIPRLRRLPRVGELSTLAVE